MIDCNEVIKSIRIGENKGYCLSCGEEHYYVEPDARGYECERCGELKVYGAEEVLLMGACK